MSRKASVAEKDVIKRRKSRRVSVAYLQLCFQYLQLRAERRLARLSETRWFVNLGGDRLLPLPRNKKGDSFESPSRMPRTGFEPARVATLPPQSSASANSATWAAIGTSEGIISNCGGMSRDGVVFVIADCDVGRAGRGWCGCREMQARFRDGFLFSASPPVRTPVRHRRGIRGRGVGDRSRYCEFGFWRHGSPVRRLTNGHDVWLHRPWKPFLRKPPVDDDFGSVDFDVATRP